jgi:hypothetical protein
MFKKKLCVILLALIAVSIFVIGAQEDELFPVKPGSEKWKSFKSHSQKVEALQLPENKLKNMPTVRLLEACINYPMAPEISAYNTPQEGIERIIRNFNGLRELMKRDDAGIFLMQRYGNLNPMHLEKDWPLVKIGEFAFKIRYVELLLAQEQIFSRLNKIQRRRLLNLSLQKFDSKAERPDVYGLIGLSTPALLMAKVLQKENNQSLKRQMEEHSGLSQFLKTAQLNDPALLDQLVTEARAASQK